MEEYKRIEMEIVLFERVDVITYSDIGMPPLEFGDDAMD